ncbi:MAG: hypothetical protein Q9181_002951 [Wetmoreana brouardii]
MARMLLKHGQLQGAKNVLRDVFDRREAAFGEVHLESQNFIDGLLDDYCEDFEGEPSNRYHDFSDWSIIDSLIEFCMKRKAYDEVDTIVQECVFRREDTSSASKTHYSVNGDTSKAALYPGSSLDSLATRLPGGAGFRKIAGCTSKDTVAHSRVPYSRAYRFRNLDETKPEWLIVTSVERSFREDQWDLDPHEPIPGDPDGNYVERYQYSLEDEFPFRTGIKIPGALTYHICEPRKNVISINVPVVPYEHFRPSRAYREGLSYVEYIEFLRKTTASGYDEPTVMRVKWCEGKLSGRRELPIWHRSDSAATVVSGSEKRFFCGKLSISLFRYAPTYAVQLAGVSTWKKRRKKKETKGTAGAKVQDSFWGEMNRREKWDREFENRLKVGPPLRVDLEGERKEEFRQKWFADMETEKETEDSVRSEWDARNSASAEQQLLS